MRASLVAALIGLPVAAVAAAPGAEAAIRMPTNIPAQDLESALQSFAKARNLQIIFRSTVVRNFDTVGVVGNLSADETLQRLLGDTGLTYQYLDEKTVTIVPVATAPRATPAPRDSDSSDTAVETPQKGLWNWFRIAQVDTTSPPPERAAQSEAASTARSAIALEEVLVTAQKRSQNLIDVPLSVTALSGEALERAGVDNMQSLSYSVPSLVVADAGGGFQRYFIRGIGNAYSSTSLVGVYLDEADVTNNAITQLDLRAVDLERVEVLKGPQGTLYGAGSSGGTIRFLTRNPDLNRFTASGDVDVSFVRDGDSSQTFRGVLNVPVVDNVFGLRAVANIGNLGGWIDQPAAGRKDINDQNLREVRVKSLWKPMEQLSIVGSVYVHRNDGDGISGGADSDYNLALSVDPTRRAAFSSDFNIYNITGTYEFPAISLLSTSTYMNSKSSALLGLKYFVAPPPDPIFELLNSPDTRDTRSFTQEIRLSSSGEGPFHWTTGVFYKDQGIDYTTNLEFAQGGVPLGGVTLATFETSKSGSIFGDASYAVTDRAEVGAGIRYFSDKRTSDDYVLLRESKFHSVDPRVYVSYALTSDVRLYANVADGFRSGGFNGETGNLTTYDPEKVRSYEIGTKMVLLDRRLTADVAVFLSDYEDIQMFTLTTTGLGEVNNGGDARVKGIDWSVDWQATERLVLEFSGNLLDTEIVKLTAIVPTVIEGDPVDFSSDYSGRIAGTYSFMWGADLPGFVRLDYNRVGPSHVTDRSIPVPILYTSDVNDVLNARIGVQRNRWSLELYGANLTNEDRLQDPNGAFGFGSRLRPRTIGLQIGASFE